MADPTWLKREGRWFALLLVVVVGLIAVVPLGRLALAAFAPKGAFDPQPFLAEIASRSAIVATLTTLQTSMLSAVGALFIGAGFALALMLTDVRGKRLLALLYVASLMVAPQVVALAFKSMAGPGSPLLNAMGLAPAAGTVNPMLGTFGIVLVLALHHAPLVAITIAAGVRAIPQMLVEAAVIDGARPSKVCRLIVLPLIGPHLAAALLLAFVAAVGNFGIPVLLGLPANVTTLPVLIYRRLTSFGPTVIADAAALSMVVAAIAGLAIVLGGMVMRGSATRLEFDRPLQPLWRLGRLRVVVEAALWLVIAISGLLPLASLIATALVPALGVTLTLETATFSNFVEVVWRQGVTTRALGNSLLLSATAAVLCAGLAVLIAYALDRHAGRWRSIAEALIELPYALPGVVLAVAMILLLLRPLPLIGISLYATPWIILAAYIARFLPLALKPSLAAMGSLGRDPEEAAIVFGAGPIARLRYVILPAVLPAATAGALLVFLTAFNELTVSALLWSAGTETLGVALFSLEEAGLAPLAAAVALVATAVVVAIMLLLDWLGRYLPDAALPWRVLAGAGAA